MTVQSSEEAPKIAALLGSCAPSFHTTSKIDRSMSQTVRYKEVSIFFLAIVKDESTVLKTECHLHPKSPVTDSSPHL